MDQDLKHKDDWWRLSDDDVCKVDEEDVLDQGGVFMLFYERVPNTEDNPSQPVNHAVLLEGVETASPCALEDNNDPSKELQDLTLQPKPITVEAMLD